MISEGCANGVAVANDVVITISFGMPRAQQYICALEYFITNIFMQIFRHITFIMDVEVMYMDYSKYQKSRDLSWQILHEYHVTELPVKISNICKSMHIRVTDYQSGQSIIDKFHLQNSAENNDGFTFQNIIFYNNKCSIARQRFTVAHELGHCLLHKGNGLYNREPSENDNPVEQEANVFASRILAPACVLWGIGVTSANQISDICNISIQSAEFRLSRMQELYDREQQFILKYGKSCFLQSPLERIVYSQFRDFIYQYSL